MKMKKVRWKPLKHVSVSRTSQTATGELVDPSSEVSASCDHVRADPGVPWQADALPPPYQARLGGIADGEGLEACQCLVLLWGLFTEDVSSCEMIHRD